jgi:hypothetical protein
MSERAEDGFDFGTSPHGLSAEHPQAVGKPAEESGCAHPAKPVLAAPEVYRSEKVRSACRTIKAAAAEHHYPLVLSASQMRRVERALSLAIEDAIQAMSDEPHGRHEIQPDIDAYNQIHRLLEQSRLSHKAHKGQPNDDWRRGEL